MDEDKHSIEREESNEGKGYILLGLLLCATMNISFLLILLFSIGTLLPTSNLGVYLLYGFGLVQFLLLYPLIRHLKRTGKTRTMQGILIGAGITFLLTTGCCMLLLPLKL